MSNTQRFQASSYRETIRQVREALGNDALIISSRQTPEGVEIVAGPGSEQGRDEPRQGKASPERPASTATPTPRADARQRLLQLGLSPWLAADLAENCPLKGSLNERLRSLLLQRMTVPELPADEIIDQVGIVALVGPTGIGKTTTLAKLAVRCADRYGSDALALVCGDGNRPGAADHLAYYADLLGVELHILAEDQSLAELEQEIGERRMILVDTAGLGPRDPRLPGNLQRLAGTQHTLLPILVMNAAAQSDALDAALVRYTEVMHDTGLSATAAILTKLDEAPHPGPALGMLIEHGLALLYSAAGQRVPEDLEQGDVAQLIDEALQAVQWSPLQAVAEEADVLTRALSLERLYHAVFDAIPGAGPLAGACLTTRPPEFAAATPRGLAWYRDGGLPALGVGEDQLPLVAPAGAPGAQPRDFPATLQVLASLPDTDSWLALGEQDISWLVPAHNATRVWHEGIRSSLLQLRGLAQAEPGCSLVRQGSTLQVSLSSLAVGLPLSGRRRRCSGLARVWYADMRQPDSGRRVLRRVWLAPGHQGPEEIARLAALQLLAEDLDRLRLAVLEQLPGLLGQGVRSGREWFGLAHGLAAMALRLARDTASVDPDLRAGLLALAGRRRRSDAAMLEALLQLCQQYRALQLHLPVRRTA